MELRLAQLWAMHSPDFLAEAPLTVEHAQIAFYLGAIAYSDCLRQGVTTREEAENFLVSHPLITR
jgi:hypothetical protein